MNEDLNETIVEQKPFIVGGSKEQMGRQDIFVEDIRKGRMHPDFGTDQYNSDLRNILLIPKNADSEKYVLKNSEEKRMFRNELKESVLGALAVAFQDEETRGIYEEINEVKEKEPGVSLFTQIQDKLEILADNPENFKVKNIQTGEERTLSEYKREEVKNGLHFARRILLETAKDAGVFESLNRQIKDIQESMDYERAMGAVDKLAANSDRLWQVETEYLNRASPDFGGMSDAYVTTALERMAYHYHKAKTEVLTQKASAVEEDDDKSKFLEDAEQSKRKADDYERRIEIVGWGKPREVLTQKAKNDMIYGSSVSLPYEQIASEQGVVKEMDGQSQAQKLNAALDKLSKTSEEGAEYQRALLEQQLLANEMLMRGYKSLIQVEKVRARMNPETFDQSLPPWYEKLGAKEQGIVRARLAINYQASIMRDLGMTNLKAVTEFTGLRFERRDFANMWDDMPGFRWALASILKKTMDTSGRKDHFVISNEGYGVLKDQADYEDYKDELIEKISGKFQSDGKLEEYMKRYPGFKEEEILKELATAAVSSADNLLLAFGVFASADEQRGISGNPNIVPEQMRLFYQPGQKWEDKFKKGSSWGGPLGDWLSENVRAGRMTKRDAFRFMPRRLFYSGLDTVTIGTRGEEQKFLSVAMLENLEGESGKIEEGLYDFNGGSNSVDLNKLRAAELNGAVADPQSDIMKLFLHLRSNDPHDRISPSTLPTIIRVMKKDKRLEKIMTEDLAIASIALMASPERGLVHGTRQMILDIDPAEVDMAVTRVVQDDRIFSHFPTGFRKRVISKLNAHDQDSIVGVILATHFSYDSFLSLLNVSHRERKKAKKRRKKILGSM